MSTPALAFYDKPPAQGEKLNTNYNYPGPKGLRKVIEARYRHLRFNGLYAPRPVAGSNTPSAHQVARGIDFSVDDEIGKKEAEDCFKWLIANAEKVGIQGVIFNRRIWGFGNKTVRITHPNGNPHTDHIHLEQNEAGAKLSEQEVIDRLTEGFLMALTDDEQKNLLDAVARIDASDDKLYGGPSIAPEDAFVGRTDIKLKRVEDALVRVEQRLTEIEKKLN